MCFDICYIGDKKMKTIVVGNTKYYVQTRDDMVSIAHELAKKGYNISQIADLLGVTEKTVLRYLQDCW